MFALSPYRISVKQRGEEKALWNGAQGSDRDGFQLWLKTYLESQIGNTVQKNDRKIVRITRLSCNLDHTYVSGIIRSGDYGHTSELLDSSSNTVTHRRSVKEAEMIPFYFSFAVPEQATWGVLLLQRFKNFGIKDLFLDNLRAAFREKYGTSKTLCIDKLVPATFMSAMLEKATVKNMRFVRYSMPHGIEDSFKGFEENVSEWEMIVKAKKKSSLPITIQTIRDVIEGRSNLASVATIPDWDYDAVKLEVDYGGRRRTLDIGRPNKVTANLDITDDVEVGDDGHPVWEDISSAAAEFSGSLLSQGIKVEFNLDEMSELFADS